MSSQWLKWRVVLFTLFMAATTVGITLADGAKFSVLYSFEAPDLTFASPLGSQPDTRPVLGRDHAVYGMTSDGGTNGNGVIYRFDLRSKKYTVLHTFGALDLNGDNEDGATPGVALTRGPDDVFYGMAIFGGANGNGIIFKITTSGKFTVLHTFSALDTNGNNEDGAHPLRTIVVGEDGNLYGTTRLGGQNICAPTGGCGVTWTMDRWGNNFRVLHQFTDAEGHAASLLQARDDFFYGCAVWPSTSLPNGTPLRSGILYRMRPSGKHFEVLYTFSQTDSTGANSDGAGCYEPLVETKPGVFYGTTAFGGTNGNGVVFRFSLSKPNFVEILHAFGATTAFDAITGFAENLDGVNPFARLTLGDDGAMYATASNGGTNGNGVVFRIRPDGDFKVLHTFSAADPTTGANTDGAVPDYGVILDDDNGLIGIADYGGNGSSAGFFNSGGTLYELKSDDESE